MSNQICLKWNSFLNNIASSFESLWEEEGLVDVTLASDGQCLTAHKVILSASSPFFKKVFQTNPCKHPVIIFQDVHFSELEALLIFIYKGEVNIEQKNLPALLKAAETLQIRGLSGNDALTGNSYTEFGDFEKKLVDKINKSPNDEPPKRKKQKMSKERDSILESVLSSRGCTSSITSETSNSDKSVKDAEIGETMANPIYDPLELKVEPFEVTMEELQKDTSPDPEPSKLDPDTSNEAQDGRDSSDELTGLSTITGLSGFNDVNTLRYPYQQLPYAELLPAPSIIETWASSRPMDHLACDLMKLLFTPEERILCNVNGTSSKSPVKVIAEAPKNLVRIIERDNGELTEDTRIISGNHVELTLDNVDNKNDCDQHVNNDCTTLSAALSNDCGDNSQMIQDNTIYPPFPCPFCDKAYASWGFRRRHIKAVHTISPKLTCKWCAKKLSSHEKWKRHVISSHSLSEVDAHNGLLILEEAHMVLQNAHPTRLDTLVNIIKQNSQQNTQRGDGQSD